MLTTNMIRKDLNSQNMYDAGVALSSLACFISPDLARDLSNDIMSLLTSTKPYIRKKAVLILYKVFLRQVLELKLNLVGYEQFQIEVSDSVTLLFMQINVNLSDNSHKIWLNCVEQ